MVVILIILIAVNLILWAVLLIKFKKLFSTKKIIDETRREMDLMIKDINANTERNILLVRNSINQLDSKINDAELKMKLFSEATERLRNMIGEADRINKLSNQNALSYKTYYQKKTNQSLTQKKVSDAYKNQNESENEINPNLRFEINNEITKNSNVTNVTQDGAAYREVPLLITKVFDDEIEKSENHEIHKKQKNNYENFNEFQNELELDFSADLNSKKTNLSLNEQIARLFHNGYSASQISAELGCSESEVLLVIDLL